MLRLLPALTVALLVGPACRQVGARDVEAVARRYPLRHDGVCSSWLYSQETRFPYCASPAIKLEAPVVASPAAPAFKSLASGGTDQVSLAKHGESVYGAICATCHQANGEGVAGTFPPLAGAGEFYGSAQNQARIIVHGLSGEITVKGQVYNGAMPSQGGVLSDYDIASVATYVRNSWGNNDGIVLPADVAAVR